MTNPYNPHGTFEDYERWKAWEVAHPELRTPNPFAAPEPSRNGHRPAGVDAPTSSLDRLRSALLDTSGLDRIASPEPILDGVLYADSIAWLIGPPGHGKSFVALDIAGSVGTGEAWQGYRASPGPVLYLIAEGASGLRQRVRAWESANGHSMVGVRFLPMPVQAAVDGDWQALCKLAGELKATLIVVDTQARSTVGMEENSARDMGLFVAAAERLRKASGACVLVVHHQGRTGEHMRGSTALEGAATTILRVTKVDDVITLACAKQKDAAPFNDIALRLASYGESAVLMLTDGKPGHSSGPSFAALKTARAWSEHHGQDWISASKLVDVVAPKTTVYRHIQELEKAGHVQVDRGGRFVSYRLVVEVEQL